MQPNISPQLSARLDTANRAMTILWFALMVSIGAYGLIVFMLVNQGGEAADALHVPAFAFPIVGVVLAITGIALYKLQTSPERLRALLDDERPAQPHEPELTKLDLRLSRVSGQVCTGAILRWALFEAVAIIGLVHAVSSRSFEDFVPYGVAAVALMAMTPPKIRQVVLSVTAPRPSSRRR